MSIREIIGKGKENIQEKEYRSKRQPECGDMFQQSLIQNLKCRDQENDDDTVDKIRSSGRPEHEERANRKDDRAGVGVAGKVSRIRVSEAVIREAVQPAEVRHMSYEESDNIEIAVTEGYTLKGKAEGRQVYVEAKYEDGRFEAYNVDMAKVQEQTQHRIERFALETAGAEKQ